MHKPPDFLLSNSKNKAFVKTLFLIAQKLLMLWTNMIIDQVQDND